MPDRKQFLKPHQSSSELLELLQASSQRQATEEELSEQRISFAFGNADRNSGLTKDDIRAAASSSRLRR